LLEKKEKVMKVLTRDDLMMLAPSVYSTGPSPRMSSQYTFMPTFKIIDALQKTGLVPVAASQSKSRGRAEHGKHMIRFRRMTDMDKMLKGRKVGDEVPEVVLLNSHDGSARYQLYAGLFRLVCLNGMIIQSMSFGGASLIHRKEEDAVNDVIEGSYKVIKDMPKVMSQVDKMKDKLLTNIGQMSFGRDVLRAGLAPAWATPLQVIAPVRIEDGEEGLRRSVWNVFNSAQEHIIKGGLVNTVGERASRTREIKAPADNLRTNTALWGIAQDYAGA
jgi:hypothetical protein